MEGFKMNAVSFGESGSDRVASKLTPLQMRGMRAKQLLNSIFAQPFCCGHDTQTYSLTYLQHEKSNDKNFEKIYHKFGMLASDVCEMKEHRYRNVNTDVEAFITYISKLDGIDINPTKIIELIRKKYEYPATLIEQVDMSKSFRDLFNNLGEYVDTYVVSGTPAEIRDSFYDIIGINCQLAVELGCGCINCARYIPTDCFSHDQAGYFYVWCYKPYNALECVQPVSSSYEFKKIYSYIREYSNGSSPLLEVCERVKELEDINPRSYRYDLAIKRIRRDAVKYYNDSRRKFLDFKSDVYNAIQKSSN